MPNEISYKDGGHIPESTPGPIIGKLEEGARRLAASGIVSTIIDIEKQALGQIKTEHPDWFIEYKQGTKQARRYRDKAARRQKKIYHAMAGSRAQIKAKMTEAVVDTKVEIDLGTAEEEINYLENILGLEE